jgi:hypothetical protein
VVVDDFDIGWSFLFPLKTDSELVVDPDAVLAGTFTLESFQSIATKGSQVLQRLSGVQPDQPCASLILDGDKLDNALIVQKFFRPRVLKRRDRTYTILLSR